MMRRLLRRRRAAPVEMLKWFAVLFLVLAVSASCSPSAFAAGDRKPVTRCDSTIRWYADTTYGGWDTADAAIRWAYARVAPVTRTTAVQESEARVVWEWQNSMSGGVYNPGEDYWDETLLSGRHYWVHAKDGDGNQFHSVSYAREVVLRDILRDFGVPKPTSTSTGLSQADRHALRGLCRAGAADTARPNNDDGVDREDTRSGDDAVADDERPQAPDWATALAGLAALALAAGLLAYLVAPGVLLRGSRAFKALRARVSAPLLAGRRTGRSAREWSGGGSE